MCCNRNLYMFFIIIDTNNFYKTKIIFKLLKLEIQKYRKILIWYFYGNFTSFFLIKSKLKLVIKIYK